MSMGTCPADGTMPRPVSLLDYIFAIDVMPMSKTVLAQLVASDNEVLSYHSPTCEHQHLSVPRTRQSSAAIARVFSPLAPPSSFSLSLSLSRARPR